MIDLHPLRFEPILKERVWGGRRLAALGKPLPEEGPPIGESWELSDLPEGQSRVADGALAGITLGELVRERGSELLGPASLDGGAFPLLVKTIDAAETLSVQVHPDVDAAARLGGRPKSEAWVILDASPGAVLYLGLRPGTTRAALEAAIAAGRVEELLRTVAVRAGDVVAVRPGTVHALGGGVLLAEVQQPSDTTYRIYDWGRLGLDGRPRALHVSESLEAVELEAAPVPLRAPTRIDLGPFTLEVTRVGPDAPLPLAGEGPLALVGLEGTAELEGGWPGAGALSCARGAALLLPHVCRRGQLVAGREALVLAVRFPAS
jgi:mannose-6-phosphate isomerase